MNHFCYRTHCPPLIIYTSNQIFPFVDVKSSNSFAGDLFGGVPFLFARFQMYFCILQVQLPSEQVLVSIHLPLFQEYRSGRSYSLIFHSYCERLLLIHNTATNRCLLQISNGLQVTSLIRSARWSVGTHYWTFAVHYYSLWRLTDQNLLLRCCLHQHMYT